MRNSMCFPFKLCIAASVKLSNTDLKPQKSVAVNGITATGKGWKIRCDDVGGGQGIKKRQTHAVDL